MENPEIRKSGEPKQPRVSVVIPVHNARQYIGRAIRSVLEQTYPPFEVIVVDDGSTDGTEEQIQTEFGTQVRYCYRQQGGPSAARNTGIKLCSGDWIAFLDADDFWEPNKLELQISEILSHPEVSCVFSGSRAVSPDGKTIGEGKVSDPFTRERFRKQLKVRKYSGIALPGVIVRRDALERLGGFDEDLICGEDRELYARIVSRYEISVVRLPLVNVTRVATSVSSNPAFILEYGLMANKKITELLADSSRLGPWKDWVCLRRADSYSFAGAAYMHVERDEAREAAWTILRSLTLWPFQHPVIYTFAIRVILRALLGKRSEERKRSKRKLATESKRNQ